MGLFGRLTGSQPPRIPAGARLVIADRAGWPGWWVAYVLVGDDADDVAKQHRCSPFFDQLGDAQAYRDWIEDPKGKPFRYPTGAA